MIPLATYDYNGKCMPDRFRKVVDEVVEVYCKWLNQYNDVPDMPDYEPGMFLDSKVNQFADTRLVVREDAIGEYEEHAVFEVIPYDGDDGGPAMLYVYAKRNWHYDDLKAEHLHRTLEDSYTINFILQEFDTMFSPVWNGDPETLYKN